MAHCANSRLVCKISGEVMNENNPPMMLPNGYVYGYNVSFKASFVFCMSFFFLQYSYAVYSHYVSWLTFPYLCFSVTPVHSSRWQGDMPQDQRGFQLFPGWKGLYYVMEALHWFWNVNLRRRRRLCTVCRRMSIFQPLFHSSEYHWRDALALNWSTRPSLNWWFRITMDCPVLNGLLWKGSVF